MAQAPQDAAEETKDARGVAIRQVEAAQQQVEIVAVGGAHRLGRVGGGLHGLREHAGEAVEVGGGGGRLVDG